MMKKLMESTIPENYSASLDKQQLEVSPNHTDKIAVILFTAVSNCLKVVKDKDKQVAFKFSDLKGDLIAAALVEFHKSDDKDNPGNWSYVWTFDEKDIKPDAYVLSMNSTEVHQYFVAVASSKYNMAFEGANYIVQVTNEFLETLKRWLTDNASDKQEEGVILDGVFQARVAIEDGEVVKSIEVIGETKALIKGDGDIEVK